MSKKPPKFEAVSREYASLWDSMEITRDESVMEKTVDRIIEFRAAYEEVERITGVPWFIIGIMDIREGGGGARKHLHNGDSLKKPTWQVPANRPPGKGPFTFVESAVDCVRDVKGWHKINDWTVERMAYVFETMNGFGYRQYRKMRSPYLWGGTSHQQPGKYVADHVFDKTVMDVQHGCMPLLKLLSEKADFKLKSMYGATCDPSVPSPASNAKAEEDPGISAAAKAGLTVVGTGAGTAVLSPDTVATMVPLSQNLVQVKGNAGALLAGVSLGKFVIPVLILAVFLAAAWFLGRKRDV